MNSFRNIIIYVRKKVRDKSNKYYKMDIKIARKRLLSNVGHEICF